MKQCNKLAGNNGTTFNAMTIFEFSIELAQGERGFALVIFSALCFSQAIKNEGNVGRKNLDNGFSDIKTLCK
jgi:hypothetical protein